MNAALATVGELETRLGYPLDGSARDTAEAILKDASAVVRTYGLPWPDPDTAPAVARAVTLSVAERITRNPDGVRSEMAASYQYSLPASAVTGMDLTPGEARMIRAVAGITGLHSVPISSIGGEL